MFDKEFLIAALNRALWTGAEAMLSMLTVGTSVFKADWIQIVGITLMAMLVAFLKCIVFGMPEVKKDGKFIIDDTDPMKTHWTLQYDGDPETLKVGDKVTFEVVADKEEI